MKEESKLINITDDIINEAVTAKSVYNRDFTSNHEAYGVILEELDELWDEIKKKNPDKDRMRTEATQTAAMLLRFINELT